MEHDIVCYCSIHWSLKKCH